MPHLPKLLLNKHVVFVTTSVEEGFPFPPNPLINLLLLSSLARAQHHHPVSISHYLFESTHAHFMILVENPEDVVGFMERFKTESSHAVNRLLGKKKHTIWCEGYDSPTVLTLDKAIDKIVYLYTNPSKDNLEDTLDRYPGLSSWGAFRSGKHTKRCAYIRRDELYELRRTDLSLKQFEGLARRLRNKAEIDHVFRLKPDSWMEAFGVHAEAERAQINTEIVRRIGEREAEYRAVRSSPVVGAKRLMLRPMDTPYIPKRTGRKMWCLSGDIDLRKRFIAAAKALVKEAKRIYQRWRVGDFSRPYPLGLFAPRVPKLANPIGSIVSCG